MNNSSKLHELERVLSECRQQFDSTVISFPERDPHGFTWGDPRYNGNCTAKVPLGLLDRLGCKSVAEVFAGSGSLSDCCRDYGIPYVGIDLNPNPVRQDIVAMDILDYSRELPDGFSTADFCFSHPPYPGIRRIRYADSAWRDTVGGLTRKDIQTMSFEQGMRAVNEAHMRTYAALPAGAFLAMLVGEIRAAGKYYSMAQHLALPGEIFQTYIKIQNGTWSDRQNTSYGGNQQRALTAHEVLVVVRKPTGFKIGFLVPVNYSQDIRDSVKASWKDVVLTYARERRHFTNSEMYADLMNHERGRNNHDVGAKLRQTCQRLAQAGLLYHLSEGEWSLAA